MRQITTDQLDRLSTARLLDLLRTVEDLAELVKALLDERLDDLRDEVAKLEEVLDR